MWSQYIEVAHANLAPLVHSMLHLTTSIRAYAAGVPDEELQTKLHPEEDWNEDLQLIGSAVYTHTSPPTALASGARGASHKALALLHQWWLETLASIALDDFADLFACGASDLGVEIGIPDLFAEQVQKLLPPWMDRP
jgi:hypothetical protein